MPEYNEFMCRVCLQDYNEDFESVFVDDNTNDDLSALGFLYEELFHLAIHNGEPYPKFLCNYCNLQLKLFHKFKTKAVDSFTKFSAFDIGKNDDFNTCELSNDEEAAEKFKYELDLSEEKLDETTMTSLVEKFGSSNKDSPMKLEQEYNDDTAEDCLEFEEVTYLEEALDDTLEVPTVSTPESVVNDKAPKKLISETFPCKSCDQVFDVKAHLTKHRRDVHKPIKYTCTQCPKKFISQELLKVHINIHNGLPGIQCELCNKTFKQRAHYIYHNLGHRNERNVQCHLCSKGFLNKSDLRIHLRMHTDERRYECDICGQKFRAYSHMSNHRYTHLGKTLECEFCLQKYTSPSTLKMHIKSVHRGECPYICDICSKPFKRKHHLKAHQKTHLPKAEIQI